MKSLIRRVVIGIWRTGQTVCLIVGMSLALLFVAELLYRGARGARRAISSSVNDSRPANPLESQPWYAGYSREADIAQALVWKPYVYFRRKPSFDGEYITIDSLGRRVTPQAKTAGENPTRIFFFGGSTVWGWFQRDAFTIPAVTARRLDSLRAIVGPVSVTNFGETGYVFTQEMLELMLQLRSGNIPDIVIFYDGINDVASTLQAREGGLPQNESKRDMEFALGRDLDRARYNYVFSKDMKAIGRLAVEGFEHLAIVERLRALKSRNGPPLFPTDSAVASTASMYIGNVRIIEALSKAYGFEVIYIWQPTLYTTQKQLTPYEALLKKSITGDSVQRRLADIHNLVPPRLDSALVPMVGSRFINATGLFKGESYDVYADRSGHATEESVPTIVDSFFPELRAAIERHAKTRSVRPAHD